MTRAIDLRDAAEQHLNDLDLTDTSLRARANRINNWLEWLDDHSINTVDDLDSDVVDAYVDHLRNRDLRTVTIRVQVDAVRCFLRELGTDIPLPDRPGMNKHER